jgi:hypothetical protein
MAGYGLSNYSDFVVPPQIDLAALAMQTADGVSEGALLQRFVDAHNAYNRMIATHSGSFVLRLGGLLGHYDNLWDVRQSAGVFEAWDYNDVAQAPTDHQSQIGWATKQLPITNGWRGVGRTLDVMTEAQVLSSIGAIYNGMIEKKRKYLLTRIFDPSVVRVDDGNGTGYQTGVQGSYAWAGDPNAPAPVPPYYSGHTFDNTHSHILASTDTYPNTADGVYALWRDLTAKVKEHGYWSSQTQPILLIHSEDDRATVTTHPDYVQMPLFGVVYPVTQGLANPEQFEEDDRYIVHGMIKSLGVYCISVPGAPGGYYGVAKSNGIDSPDNPLRYTFLPSVGPVAELLDFPRSMPPSGRSTFFGLHIRERYGITPEIPWAWAVGKIASASYTAPTIV